MDWARRRRRMVERYVSARGISDARVLQAMEEVPRHLFVEEALQDRAYGEESLPIGSGQTISRPYTVARLSEILEVDDKHTVLEVGTGSGYQAAVLARLADWVYTLERIPDLSRQALEIFRQLKIRNIQCRVSDGSVGWPSAGPFERIMVTAGSPAIPGRLVDQLAPETGRLVVPVGPSGRQVLTLVRIQAGKVVEQEIEPCEFVPLIRGG